MLGKKFNLDELDKNAESIDVIIPDYIVTFTPSFFLGLFSKSLDTLGEDGFFRKYHFKSTREIIQKQILSGVEDWKCARCIKLFFLFLLLVLAACVPVLASLLSLPEAYIKCINNIDWIAWYAALLSLYGFYEKYQKRNKDFGYMIYVSSLVNQLEKMDEVIVNIDILQKNDN